MTPAPPVCAVLAGVLCLAPAVARADGLSTVTKDDEQAPERALVPEFPCIFPPSLERLGRETQRPVKRLVKRCRIAPDAELRVSMLVDLAGNVREPHVVDGLAPEEAACFEAGMKRWKYSRAAVASLEDFWEPAHINLAIAVAGIFAPKRATPALDWAP